MTGAPVTDLRPLLFSIAYRMVGSVSEAEDLVQEAFLRFQSVDEEAVESPKAYLSAVTTRLAIDHLRSARVRRERYVGTWLPEPLLTDTAPGPAQVTETAESLSLAFLAVLERLSPVERAVFLLREVFDYGYDEIAEIVERTPDNCRQLFVRARRHVEAERPRFEPSREQHEELARRFLAATRDGDTDGLVEMLAEDVVLYGDGGGKVPAIRRPIHGPADVARILAAWSRIGRRDEMRLEPAMVNGQPGAVIRDTAGRVFSVLALDIAGGAVRSVRSIVNPEKLAHLGPLARPDRPA
jgi:RNA polymerase sigma-70 factor (ECF subfamily)